MSRGLPELHARGQRLTESSRAEGKQGDMDKAVCKQQRQSASPEAADSKTAACLALWFVRVCSLLKLCGLSRES